VTVSARRRPAPAFYEVLESIASMVRHEADCRITLPHSIVPIPRDMVTIVWPTGP